MECILASIFLRFWWIWGAKLGRKIDQNSILKGIKKLIDFCIDFWSNFGAILGPSWAPRRRPNCAKRQPRQARKATTTALERLWAPKTDFDRFFIDFSSIFHRFLIDFRSIFDRFSIDFLVDFWSTFDRFSIDYSIGFWSMFDYCWIDLKSILDDFLVDVGSRAVAGSQLCCALDIYIYIYIFIFIYFLYI